MDAHGPRTTVATPTPTACPVVPPGSGTLNIMMTKQNALTTASRGTKRVFRRRFTRANATYQNGIAVPYSTAQVEGLRYPSGMCMRQQAHVGSRPDQRPTDHSGRQSSTIVAFVLRPRRGRSGKPRGR